MTFSRKSIALHCCLSALIALLIQSVPALKAANGTCSPAKLQAKMADIAQVTHGPVGAAVVVMGEGSTAALHGEQHFPMQSVYKLPIAMAVLHQIDLGKLRLDQRVQIKPGDLDPPSRYSLITEKYPNGTQMTISELLGLMMNISDGTACDVLLKQVGGPDQVTVYLRRIGVQDIVVATTEAEMAQNEQVQYRNWATPNAMLKLLCALQQGRGLSASSRHLLLSLMVHCQTGTDRIKGLLPVGTVVAHKTGSSGTVNGITRATNDAGLITLPDGRHLAVVVFVSDTRANETTRDGVIARITQAAWNCRAALEGSQ